MLLFHPVAQRICRRSFIAGELVPALKLYLFGEYATQPIAATVLRHLPYLVNIILHNVATVLDSNSCALQPLFF